MRPTVLALTCLILFAGCDKSQDQPTIIMLPTSPTPTSSSCATCPTQTCATCPIQTTPITQNPVTPTLPTTPIGSTQPRLPDIANFGADSILIAVGNVTFLRWEVLDLTGNTTCRIDPMVGNVSVTGTILISPRITTTYMLTCRNLIGTVQRAFTVFVRDSASSLGAARLYDPVTHTAKGF